MDLKEIREHIDKLDNELVSVLAKRMMLIPKIAGYKKENNIARNQPRREKEIIEARRQLAKNLGVNQDLVEDIFKKVIKDAKRIQKEIIEKKSE